MKDYDQERANLEGVERTFKLGGVEFRAAPTMPAEALSDLADLQAGVSTAHSFQTVSSVVRRTLLPVSRPDWDALLERDDLPVPIDLGTLLQVADDLVTAATGRPTPPPSPSSNTPASTGTRSTEDSASLAEADSQPLTPARS